MTPPSTNPRTSSLGGRYSTISGEEGRVEEEVDAEEDEATTEVEGRQPGDWATESPSFSELYGGKLPAWLVARAAELGFTSPTEVQRRALDPIMEGKDAIVQAQTGSGKTLAYMLPLLAKINPERKAIQALVVVPSRELGLQVASVAKRLAAGRAYYRDQGDDDCGDDRAEDEDEERGDAGADGKVKPPSNRILIMSLLEGSKNRRQRAWAWAEPPHVVVGNPEALLNMVVYGGLRYHNVNFVVLDEVDACLLSEETREELHTLLAKYLSPSYMSAELLAELEDKSRAAVPAGIFKEKGSVNAETLAPWKVAPRQTVFCSATIPQHNHFIKQCLQNQWSLSPPVHVHVTPGELMPAQLSHQYLTCPEKIHKAAALRAYLSREVKAGRLQACVVFLSKDSDVDEAVRSLEEWESSTAFPAPSFEGEPLGTEAGAGGEEAERRKGSTICALRSTHNIRKRATVMEDFRQGRCSVLVTTDFASRGLDIPQISHVILYDIPDSPEAYLHRGGRAGRLNRPGVVCTLVAEKEEFVLERLANALKVELTRVGKSRAKGSTTKRRRPRASSSSPPVSSDPVPESDPQD